MKENVISEGKIYISSKRASEISDYSSDYIGQLCRSGKLDSKMVGHSWFVTERSLSDHRQKVIQEEIYRNRFENLRARKGRTLAQEAHSRPSRRVSFKKKFLTVLVLALLVGAGSLASIAFFGKVKARSSSQTASIADSIQGASALIWKEYGGMVSYVRSFFGGSGSGSGNGSGGSTAPDVAMESTSTSTWNGIAVVPSTGSAEDQQETEQQIQQSFSDQVEVQPDKSGTTGVITPEFRNATGTPFVYVLVPVKKNGTDPP